MRVFCSVQCLEPSVTMNQPMNITSNVPESKTAKLLNVSEEQQVQIFARQMLSKRLFVGHYQERRYVDALNSYRDIVCVSDTEDDLPRDLSIVKKRIQQMYPSHVVWTGITGPEMTGAPAGCCLWVKLNSIPFGHYWFQIREVKFIENMEICVRLKCLRSVNPDGGSVSSTSAIPNEQPANSNTSPDETLAKEDTNEFSALIDFQKVLSSVKDLNYHDLILGWISSLSVLFTPHNMKQVLSFLVILIITAGTGFVKFVAYLGEFSIRVMREISVFVQVCTPVLLGIIDFFTKCVGGVLLLISIIWRGSPPSNTFQQTFQPQQRSFPALPAGSSRPQPRPPPSYRQNRNSFNFQ